MDSFYMSREWKSLRYKVLRKYESKCMLCLSREKSLHVDHIKPRSKYPELELDINNLQILCSDCNMGKSNKYEDDFREKRKRFNAFIAAKEGGTFHIWRGLDTLCGAYESSRLKITDNIHPKTKLSHIDSICLYCINATIGKNLR